MKEDDGGGRWFTRWEEQLPSPDDLIPLSQTLITPDLALAFDIPTNMNANTSNSHLASNPHHHHSISPSDFDSSDLNSGGGAGSGGGIGGADEPARTLKRPRLVWTPQLHKRFVDSVAHLGIKNAVPKTIMQLMSVDGLTRENVASHLQKYRLYLKRMQGISVGGGGGAGSVADAATDQLFASTAVPAHFLRPGAVSGGGGGSENFLPYVPVGALQHQISSMQQQQHQQQQYYQQRNLGQFGYANGTSGGGGNGGFDHGFLSRAMPQPGMHRVPGMGMGMGLSSPQQVSHVASSYIDELESGGRGGGEGSGSGARRVLTLFPTGED